MLLKQGQEGQLPDYLQAVGPQALCLASLREVLLFWGDGGRYKICEVLPNFGLGQ